MYQRTFQRKIREQEEVKNVGNMGPHPFDPISSSVSDKSFRSAPAPVFQLSDGGTPIGADEIPDEHIAYNYIAHLTYNSADGIRGNPEATSFIDRFGYDVHNAQTIEGQGGFVMMYLPSKVDTGLPPIVSFRGTEGPTAARDWNSNLCYLYPGQNQFNQNRDTIEQLLNLADQPAIVIGHSLGGALAQRTAIEFGDRVGNLVTFQAPGVLPEGVHNGEGSESTPVTTHYIAENDVVDRAGMQHTSGETINIAESIGPLAAHGPIFSSNAFNQHRERLGIPTATAEGEDPVVRDQVIGEEIRSFEDVDTMTRYHSYPYSDRSLTGLPVKEFEALRLGVAASRACRVSRGVNGILDLFTPPSEVPEDLIEYMNATRNPALGS